MVEMDLVARILDRYSEDIRIATLNVSYIGFCNRNWQRPPGDRIEKT